MSETVTARFEELARGATELHLHLKSGDISVRAVDDGEWQLGWDADHLEPPEIERRGDALHIKQVHETFGRLSDVDVTVAMPRTVTRVELKTGAGDVSALGISGHTTLHTGRGDLALEDCGSSAELHTGHGDVDVKAFDGELKVNSGHGDLEIGRWRGRAVLRTGAGDINVDGSEGEVQIRSGAGDVTVRASGDLTVEVHSGLGDVVIDGSQVRALNVRTGKGDVACSALLGAGRHEVHTGFGEISVTLPADARARIDAQSGWGQVHSDFPLVRVGRSGPMGFGGIRMVGSIGEGEPEIELSLRSGKGDMHIARGPSGGEEAADRWERPRRRPTFASGPRLADVIETAVSGAIRGIGSAFDDVSKPPTPPPPAPPPRPPAPPESPPPRAPVPDLDLSGAVRSSQTPIAPRPPAGPSDRVMAILEAVARGEITAEEADDLLGRGDPGGGRR